MKNQYVGDINDFEKYSVLRALRGSTDLRLIVAWMLTDADERGDGVKTDYLASPARYRDLDPHVFDRLEVLVRVGQRTVGAVEGAGLVEHACFLHRELQDQLSSRTAFFTELWSLATSHSLIFFDPDIGIAGKGVRKGGKRSSAYVFLDELVETFQRGHSIVVYQHFPREQRGPFVARTLGSLRDACSAQSAFALWSSRVAFFVVPQPVVATRLAEVGRELASRWGPHLSFSCRAAD